MQPLNLSGGEPDIEEARNLCESILDWAADRDTFDTTFVESVLGQIHDRKFVTANQVAALEKICAQFNI